MGFLGLLSRPSAELASAAGKSFDSAAEQVSEDMRQKNAEEAKSAAQDKTNAADAAQASTDAAAKLRDQQYRVFSNEAKGTSTYYTGYNADKYDPTVIAKAGAHVQSAEDYQTNLDKAYLGGTPLTPPDPKDALREVFPYSQDYQNQETVKRNMAVLGMIAEEKKLNAPDKTPKEPINPATTPMVVGLRDSSLAISNATNELMEAQKQEAQASVPTGFLKEPNPTLMKAAATRTANAEAGMGAAQTNLAQYHSAVLSNVYAGVSDDFYKDAPPRMALMDLINSKSVTAQNPDGSTRTMSMSDYADPAYRSSMLQQMNVLSQQHNVKSRDDLKRSYDNLYQVLGGATGTVAPQKAYLGPVATPQAPSAAPTPALPQPSAPGASDGTVDAEDND